MMCITECESLEDIVGTWMREMASIMGCGNSGQAQTQHHRRWWAGGEVNIAGSTLYLWYQIYKHLWGMEEESAQGKDDKL
jgi:hypothetical protein